MPRRPTHPPPFSSLPMPPHIPLSPPGGNGCSSPRLRCPRWLLERHSGGAVGDGSNLASLVGCFLGGGNAAPVGGLWRPGGEAGWWQEGLSGSSRAAYGSSFFLRVWPRPTAKNATAVAAFMRGWRGGEGGGGFNRAVPGQLFSLLGLQHPSAAEGPEVNKAEVGGRRVLTHGRVCAGRKKNRAPQRPPSASGFPQDAAGRGGSVSMGWRPCLRGGSAGEGGKARQRAGGVVGRAREWRVRLIQSRRGNVLPTHGVGAERRGTIVESCRDGHSEPVPRHSTVR